MAAAENGNATLEEIRSALTKSGLKINAAWENDFLAVTKNGVPLKLVRGLKRGSLPGQASDGFAGAPRAPFQ